LSTELLDKLKTEGKKRGYRKGGESRMKNTGTLNVTTPTVVAPV
jgi:hypothetical protein